LEKTRDCVIRVANFWTQISNFKVRIFGSTQISNFENKLIIICWSGSLAPIHNLCKLRYIRSCWLLSWIIKNTGPDQRQRQRIVPNTQKSAFFEQKWKINYWSGSLAPIHNLYKFLSMLNTMYLTSPPFHNNVFINSKIQFY
jgi:hypothetical protein